MTTWKLSIILDQAVLDLLPPGHLCMARKFNDVFTTVLQSASVRAEPTDRPSLRLLMKNNIFRWEDKFRVFAARRHTAENLIVGMETATDIAFGQNITWDRDRLRFGQPQTAPTPAYKNTTGVDSNIYRSEHNTFFVRPVSPGYNVGVQCWVNDSYWSCVHIELNKTKFSMNPLNEYLLWWSDSVHEGKTVGTTAFHSSYTFSFPTDQKTKTVRYGYFVPDLPTPGETFAFYDVEDDLTEMIEACQLGEEIDMLQE